MSEIRNDVTFPGPGRPRQPNCPDCRKIGKTRAKKPGYGYCDEHQLLRQRAYRRSSVDEITVERARELELQDEIERLRNEVVHLREVEQQNQATIENLLNPDPYAPPTTDEDDGPQESLEGWKDAFFVLRSWAIPIAEKHGEILPMQIAAYKDLKND